MPIIALAYISIAKADLTRYELEDILRAGRIFNYRRKLNSMLLYGCGLFMQVLEGEQADVEALYARIMRDPRHHHVTQIYCETTTTRHFGIWSMGYNPFTSLDLAAFPQLGHVTPHPATLANLAHDPASVLAMLAAFKDRSLF